MADLEITLLGYPRIFLDGEPAAIDRSKAVALLIYLALESGIHSRSSLAALFWPDYDQRQAYAYLRRNLYSINQALKPGWIDADRETIRLIGDRGLSIDVDRFRSLLSECRQQDMSTIETCAACMPVLEEAASLYQDDFLAGFTIPDSPAFDDWQNFQTENLRRDFSTVLEKLIHCSFLTGNYERAVLFSRQLVNHEPLQEHSHQLLMISYAQSGDRAAALRQYYDCVNILSKELGIEPEEETLILFQQIKEGEFYPTERPVGADSEPVNLAKEKVQTPAALPPSSLPSPATPFMGREPELFEILNHIRNPECRLLTLVGPGGAGKTRLAIRAAELILHESSHEDESRFSHGVLFISLVSLSPNEGLVVAFAEALDLSFRSEQRPEIPIQTPKSQLIDFLREKRVLLVVDNFEHLISQASLLLELLESSPGVKIMVTSRERLNLYGEWVLEVTGMSYPEGTPGDDELESYLSANAIELFLKNARRIHPGFTATSDDLVEIIRICQMVEGMPLGIELASSWVKVLPVGEIRREISGNLDFLSSQMTGSPERHSSMRMVFEHSWNLLKEPEKKALKKLSIFKGAFSREAARMVAGTGLNILSALMDKSLLYRSDRRVQAGEGIWGYYQMHDLVKQYAAEKLGEVPHEKTATVEEYTQYFCRRLWETRAALHSHDQERAMRRLESEIDDLRAAYYYAVQHENLNLMQQAFHSLVVFHDMKGWLNELRDLLHTGLRKLHEIRSSRGDSNQINGLYALYLAGHVNYSSLIGRSWDPAKAKEALDILYSLENPDEYLHGYILLTFGAELINPPEAFDLCQKSMAAFQQQGDLWAISASQMAFAYYCWRADDHNLALELWREALKNTRKIGDRFGIASCLDAIAQICYEKGDYPTALDYAQEALEIHHTMGGHWRQINDLMLLGQIFTALGDYQVAERHYLAGMDLARETGNRRIMAIHHDCIGYVSMLTGRYTEAEANYQDSLALYQQEDASPGMGFVYNNLGDIARKRGKNDEARKRYLRGLDILANTSESPQWRDWGRILLHKKLGILGIEEDNYTAAQNNLSQALKLAWDMERTPEVLDILIGIADLWTRQGQPVKALELTVIVSNHPATAQEAKERAGKLIEALSKTLPEKDVAAAFTAGAAADFDQFMLSLPEIYESLSSSSDRGNP